LVFTTVLYSEADERQNETVSSETVSSFV